MDAYVEYKQLTLMYPDRKEVILQGVDLSVQAEQFVSLVGRSGCGKTSMLRLAAGLLSPSSGQVKVLGQQILRPIEQLSYVFQKPVLLDWRTVLENMLLPIELERKVTAEDRDEAITWLREVGLEGAMHKYPYECSGGMLSRAALARALLTKPRLLLMDEPFAALDAITKRELQQELSRIVNKVRTTTLYVTHDIAEAVFLSDRVIILGGQPASIIEEIVIAEPRPRTREWIYSSSFNKLVQGIVDRMERGV